MSIYIREIRQGGERGDSDWCQSDSEQRFFFNLVFWGDFFRLQHIQLLYMHGIAHHAVLLKYNKVQCISPGVNQTQTRYFIQVTFLGEIFRLTHISNCRNTLHCSSCSIAQMWSSSVYFSWCQSKQISSSFCLSLGADIFFKNQSVDI